MLDKEKPKYYEIACTLPLSITINLVKIVLSNLKVLLINGCKHFLRFKYYASYC